MKCCLEEPGKQGKGLSQGAHQFPSVLSSAYNKPTSLAVKAAQMEEQSSWERSEEQSSLWFWSGCP